MSGRVSSVSHYPPKLARLADRSLKGLGEEDVVRRRRASHKSEPRPFIRPDVDGNEVARGLAYDKQVPLCLNLNAPRHPQGASTVRVQGASAHRSGDS